MFNRGAASWRARAAPPSKRSNLVRRPPRMRTPEPWGKKAPAPLRMVSRHAAAAAGADAAAVAVGAVPIAIGRLARTLPPMLKPIYAK